MKCLKTACTCFDLDVFHNVIIIIFRINIFSSFVWFEDFDRHIKILDLPFWYWLYLKSLNGYQFSVQL